MTDRLMMGRRPDTILLAHGHVLVYRHGFPQGISLLPGIRGPAAVLGDHASY